jgi:tRNA(Ile)-lysidine synthase TilS/MesJ
MNNEMRITTSQGEVVINILDTETNIGLRMSGGADSSILLYLLAIFKRDYRPDINIFPMTVVNPFKPYHEIYSQRVIDKITELTGIKIENLSAFRLAKPSKMQE